MLSMCTPCPVLNRIMHKMKGELVTRVDPKVTCVVHNAQDEVIRRLFHSNSYLRASKAIQPELFILQHTHSKERSTIFDRIKSMGLPEHLMPVSFVPSLKFSNMFVPCFTWTFSLLTHPFKCTTNSSSCPILRHSIVGWSAWLQHRRLF
jgi:hypothetical protein